MSYSQFLERAHSQRVLFSALVELTYRCNLDCEFCYNDLGLRGSPLSIAQYRTLFRDLADLGTMNLTLSGGEPLAHKDFYELGSYARELGFAVRIKSNGHAISETTARKIKKNIDPYSLEVSLHGATAKSHDRQTRVPGSFLRLQRNLRAMKGADLRVLLNCTLTTWNEHEIVQMYDLADEMELPLNIIPDVTSRDNGDTDPLKLTPSPEGIKALYSYRQNRFSETDLTGQQQENQDDNKKDKPSYSGCGTGTIGVTIDPFGNVLPCVQWRSRTAGNLHTQSIKEIWEGSTALDEVRRLNKKAAKKVGSKLENAQNAGFCPALAERYTGDATSLYIAVVTRDKLFSESQTVIIDDPKA